VRTVVHMTTTPPLDPSGNRRSNRSLKGRTSFVTAAAITAVLVAGSAAVAANIGILDAADSSAIGDLAATDQLLPAAGAVPATPTAMVEVPVTSSNTATTMPPATGPQRYDIANTGSVWVITTTSGLALDHVVAEPDWTPVMSQGDLRSLRVDFTNGDRTIVFTAALADDGSVTVDVTEPTTVVAAAPTNARAQSTSRVAPTPTTPTYSDDDHDENDEHEGADDDD